MNWIELCQRAANNLPREKRQLILNTLREGASIRETRALHRCSLPAVCGVVNMNIRNHEILTLNITSA